MLKLIKAKITILTLFIAIGAGPTLAADYAGYALLDKLVMFFNQTASSRTVSYQGINQAVSEMMAQAKEANKEGRIAPEFFDRYTRVLRIFKLRITEDKEGVLAPLINQEYTLFVANVTGRKSDGVPSIGVLSQAVTQELANLKKLLDEKQ